MPTKICSFIYINQRANQESMSGTPVIDGLGPLGAKDHSEDEYIEKPGFISYNRPPPLFQGWGPYK